jgi:hypothetical protein
MSQSPHHQVTQSTSTKLPQLPGVDLPFTLIFDYPSVASISATWVKPMWYPKIPLKMVIVPSKKTPLRGMYTQFSDTAN